MHISITVMALNLALPLLGSNAPAWHGDYGQARQASQSSGRPLAIFVIPSTDEPAQATQEGKFSPELAKILADQYVCVVLDPARNRASIRRTTAGCSGNAELHQ